MASPGSLKRKQCDFSEQTIVVEVGLQKKRFTIHPSILSNNSKFFKAALSARWRSQTNGPVSLPGEDPITFQTYISYVYSGYIGEDLLTVEKSSPKVPEAERNRWKFFLLGNLFVLGEHIEDKGLRSSVMNVLLEHSGRTGKALVRCMVKMAFEETHENSTICRFVVDAGLASMFPEWLETNYEYLPKQFLKQVMLGWAKSSVDKTIKHKLPLDMPTCTNHEHDEEVPQDESCFAFSVSAVQANKKRRFQQK